MCERNHVSGLLRRCGLACMFVFAASAGLVNADDGTDPSPVPSPVQVSGLHRAWGVAAPATVNLGMWTQHVDHAGVGNSTLIGGTYHGIFAATFLNSYHDRSYAFAVERRVAQGLAGPIAFGAGYRVGAIRGYDERMIAVAGRLPVVPFVQVLGDAMWKQKVGVQASFCVKVVTWGAIVRF